MIAILGFGARLVEDGTYSTYVELGLPDGRTVVIPAPEEFIANITEAVHTAPRIEKHATATRLRAPRPEPAPDPQVLQPDFEPPFPAVSQAPGIPRQAPKAESGFTAKRLLSSLIQSVGTTERARQPEPEPAHRPRMAAHVPIGEFLHFPED